MDIIDKGKLATIYLTIPALLIMFYAHALERYLRRMILKYIKIAQKILKKGFQYYNFALKFLLTQHKCITPVTSSLG